MEHSPTLADAGETARAAAAAALAAEDARPPTVREALTDSAIVMENVMREIDKLVGSSPIHPISAALLVTLEKAHQALAAPDNAICVECTPVEINALACMHAQEALNLSRTPHMEKHLRRSLELRGFIPDFQ